FEELCIDSTASRSSTPSSLSNGVSGVVVYAANQQRLHRCGLCTQICYQSSEDMHGVRGHVLLSLESRRSGGIVAPGGVLGFRDER
ncbi:MAG: hypothetical protein QW205_03765, partial [Desulfurococcaceae archaeon]